jgi:hypothetical protein
MPVNTGILTDFHVGFVNPEFFSHRTSNQTFKLLLHLRKNLFLDFRIGQEGIKGECQCDNNCVFHI